MYRASIIRNIHVHISLSNSFMKKLRVGDNLCRDLQGMIFITVETRQLNTFYVYGLLYLSNCW